MADYRAAEGLDCYYCGEYRCRCPELEAEAWERERQVHRTARLMRAIELAEMRIEALEEIDEFHPELPEMKERLNNLTRALLTHRKALKGI